MRLIDTDAAKNEYFALMKELVKATADPLPNNAISVLAGYSIIDNAPTVYEWISVEDHLPELNNNVLICAVRKTPPHEGERIILINCTTDRNIIDPHIKTDVHWRSPWQYFFYDYDITHLTKLPEPPEEDNNDSSIKRI